MTPLGAAGSALAIGGAFTYAMVRNQEKAREKDAGRAQEVAATTTVAAEPPDWGDACDPWVPSFACFVGQLLPGWVRPAWA